MGIFLSRDNSASKKAYIQRQEAKVEFMMSDQIVQNSHWNRQTIRVYQRKEAKQNQSSEDGSKEISSERIKQPLPFFIIHVLIASVVSFQNIFIVYGVGHDNYDNGIKMIIIDLFFIVVFSFLNSIYLVPFKTLVLMYTLLDGVLVAEIAALVGLVGSLLLADGKATSDYMLMVMIPVSFFFFVGNFRVCIRFADWNRAQIIIYKLAILAGAVCFFEIGAYFLAVNYSYTKGFLKQLDSKLKDFITLYAFGTFQFFRQMFAKICDFDETSDFKWTYQFKKETQDQSNNQDKQIQMENIEDI